MQVEDGDEGDGGGVEGNEPDAEGLEDGDVEDQGGRVVRWGT